MCGRNHRDVFSSCGEVFLVSLHSLHWLSDSEDRTSFHLICPELPAHTRQNLALVLLNLCEVGFSVTKTHLSVVVVDQVRRSFLECCSAVTTVSECGLSV